MDPDVLIIGAGLAGLTAARRLAASYRVLVLEASRRCGGRACTDHSRGMPLEHGCEFIHGASAITRRLCDEIGIDITPVVRWDNLHWSHAGQAAVKRSALPAAAAQMLETVDRAVEGAMKDPLADGDVSLREWCIMHAGLNETALAAAEVLIAQTCCTTLAGLSVADLQLDERNGCDERNEARLCGGYSRLVEALADSTRPTPSALLEDSAAAESSGEMRILTDAEVVEVRWFGQMCETLLRDGRSFAASKAVVIAVPLAALQRGDITFSPPLPDSKRAAIEAFAIHPATKLFVAFDAPQWEPSATFLAHTGTLCRWFFPPSSSEAVAEAYITADRAEAVDAMDGAALTSLALAELATLLGKQQAELAKSHRWTHCVSWANEPHVYGGYASVRPGCLEDCRQALAAPLDVLYFAGEATAWNSNPQTAHGAIESGLRAAKELQLRA